MAVHLLITAEHATNRVPPRFAALFSQKPGVLESHRGYDPGTAALARRFARRCGVPLLRGEVTRLLVELNRSPGHRRLFSEFSSPLEMSVKQELLQRYYHAYRERVRRSIREATGQEGCAVHVSVHSFTPRLEGVVRRADVGLLYDPRRQYERQLCQAWRAELLQLRRDLVVRRNYPYLGTADGLTTALRGEFSPRRYLGIELEVNQAWPLSRPREWPGLQESLIAAFQSALRTLPFAGG